MLNWNTNQNRVSADIQSVPVLGCSGGIARHTGWHVFLEPNITHNVSTKFQDLSSGPALRMLLGDLNFALVPQTNGPTHLYVFRTSHGQCDANHSPGGSGFENIAFRKNSQRTGRDDETRQ